MLIYIETSAINWLFENLRFEEAYPTRNYQFYKGRKWVTSSVTLWEIFNTSDEKRRNALLDFTRRLLHGHLIKSPEEIFITYLLKNCPTQETWSNFESEGLFSKEWNLASRDFEYFFNISGDGFNNRTYFMRRYRNLIYSYLENEPQIISLDEKIHFLDFFVNRTLEYLEQHSERENIKEASVKIAIIYTLTIVCCSLSLDFDYIEDFWKRKGINKIDVRFEYILKNHSDLFFRGPIANLARMTVAQQEASSRGMSFDALHSIYLTYTDRFLTADNHFLNLSSVIEDPNYLKVRDINDLEFFHV